MDDFYTPNVLTDTYKFSPSGTYFAPAEGDYNTYTEYIKGLPLIAQPEVFGLHENADITKDLQETNLLLNSLMMTQSGTSVAAGGKSATQIVDEVANGKEDLRLYLCSVSRFILSVLSLLIVSLTFLSHTHTLFLQRS